MEKPTTMRATAILGLVRLLLTHEAEGNQDQTPSIQESSIEVAERITDKLRAHLSKRIGQEGFRTLLARALTLTTVQFPHLKAVGVTADGSLVGLRGATDSGSQEAPDSETQADGVDGVVAAEGAVALVAHLLGLLVIFIGEDLTLRLFSAVWPELAWGDAIDGENGRP